jgi:hypothetical protein
MSMPAAMRLSLSALTFAYTIAYLPRYHHGIPCERL